MRFDRFDYFVWGVLALLALATGGLLWVEGRAGIRVLKTIPQDGAQPGANTRIEIQFAEPMQAESVIPRFSLTDQENTTLTGTFTWEGTTFIFSPNTPLTPGYFYTAQLEAGGQAESGQVFSRSVRWEFQVRAPRIIYIHPERGARDLWALAPNDRTPVQLTETGGNVYDYSVSPDGEQVVYSVGTGEGGIDLWVISEDGSAPRKLIQCSPNRCTTPAWSPDGSLVAYSFEGVGVEPGAPYGMPRVWTVNVESGQTAPLFPNEQDIGYGPTWSPEGGRMAFFDQGTGQTRVLTLETNEEVALTTSTGLPGSWSPDGVAMLFIGLLPDSGLEALFLADFNLRDVSALLSSEDMNGNFLAQPEWSPDGEWVVFNFKPAGLQVGNQLWIMPFDMSFGQILAADTNYAYYNYRWDPWSRALVYQRLELGNAEAFPEVMVWTLDSWVSEMVVNGSDPGWLP
ncbi:MAG: hypothetical protein Fur0022_43190 [Anaerolineales bacterium]